MGMPDVQPPSEDDVRPKILIVDDEREVADAYALRLKGLADVATVYDGENALEFIEQEPVDVLLLDRHMPGRSGDDVLEELAEQEFNGRVIMVTAIDPGFDVLDMPFDEYLCKPLNRENIRAAVNQQRVILGYETLGEYFSAESKRAVLRSELPVEKRESNPEYQTIKQRTDALKRRADRLLVDPDRLFEAFDDIDRESR